jgi:predicted acetyltransferase
MVASAPAASILFSCTHLSPITWEAVMHEKAELVAPSLRHARSYVAALREEFRRGAQERVSERRIRQIEADFARYIAAITDQSGSLRLPTGEVVPKVPFSVLWLVEGAEFVGETHVRHELNDYLIKEGGHVGYGIRPARRRQGYGKLILALALEECRRLGLRRVLVTCLEDNVASARIIEANGGELENVIADPAGRGALRRYWIAL